MSYVKYLKKLESIHPHLLTIRTKSSFGQTLAQIKNFKNLDFVFVERANVGQMLAVLIGRLLGKKYLWIQAFANPPAPSFLTRLLLAQADRILVKSYYLVKKLQDFGIDKSKIKIARG